MHLKVVLVDDDARILELITDVLEERGHQVISFPEPLRCPVLLREQCECPQNWKCSDLLITDLEMPGMSGLDFIENQLNYGCQILAADKAVMSGGWTKEELARAKDLGCKIFHKPFKFVDFLDWIKACERRIGQTRRQTALHVGQSFLSP